MKTLLVLIFATATASCKCGIYDGYYDKFYARGSETLTVCSLGGFVLNRASGPLEGIFGQPPESPVPIFEAANGARAFTLVTDGSTTDGSVTTPELGGAPWKLLNYDDTERDHADVQCTDLFERPWWGMPGTELPVDTAFSIPNAPVRPGEPCGRGGRDASCNIELDLCAHGQVEIVRDGVRSDGAFAINYGVIRGHWYNADGNQTEVDGTYSADGILATTDFYGGQGQTRWTRIPPDPTKPIAACN